MGSLKDKNITTNMRNNYNVSIKAGLYGNIWGYVGLCGILWVYMGLYGIIWDCMDYIGLYVFYRIIWEYIGLYGIVLNIWNMLDFME